jgi:prephenate dehydrogenase
MQQKKVLVVGLGLIGGSIALAIKKKHQATIIGFDINESHRKLALSLNVIDEEINDLQKGVQDADLIILAVPVLQTEKIIENLSNYEFKEGAIITDVGSTKQVIAAKAHKILRDRAVFIGGHPMAGSHKTGVTASKAHLFENAFYIFTPDHTVDRKHIETLKNWLVGTNAQFIEMTPTEHDEMVGIISHFPHVVAASLVQQLSKLDSDERHLSRFAAGGFRDITRIASSSPVMWRDILLHNKDVLLSLFDEWQKEMDTIKAFISTSNGEEIYRYFKHAKGVRDGLPEKSKGAIPAFYDLYVDVEDYPGVIAHVTSILGHREISITNIQIIETREDLLGVLRLSFRSDREREKAKELLKEYRYDSYITD